MVNFNLNSNTKSPNPYDLTKPIFFYSLISILLIVIFILTPFNNLFIISLLMKIIVVVILCYIFYLNLKQINVLQNSHSKTNDPEVISQININTITSYIFSLFIGLLVIFVIRGLFL